MNFICFEYNTKFKCKIMRVFLLKTLQSYKFKIQKFDGYLSTPKIILLNFIWF